MDGESQHKPVSGTLAVNEAIRRNKTAVCALTASYISTFVGYPLDSLKSRLQTQRKPISVPKLAAQVYREEGLVGFYRGFWIPLMTISFVRAASMTIYGNTKITLHNNGMLARNNLIDVAASGGLGGALAGSVISFASAPFELVKIRRQLEYGIAASKGKHITKPPSTLESVKEIIRTNGRFGLWTGIRMHFVRDTTGTGLYFLEYDGMRHLMGRRQSGEQGPPPPWFPLPQGIIPFFCGSISGVTSWALIYPLDVVKTKIQERSLTGLPPRSLRVTFQRLIRGPNPDAPQPIHVGVARIYRGLGVSATRSITTHGLLWTFFDIVAGYIDKLP